MQEAGRSFALRPAPLASVSCGTRVRPCGLRFQRARRLPVGSVNMAIQPNVETSVSGMITFPPCSSILAKVPGTSSGTFAER